MAPFHPGAALTDWEKVQIALEVRLRLGVEGSQVLLEERRRQRCSQWLPRHPLTQLHPVDRKVEALQRTPEQLERSWFAARRYCRPDICLLGRCP